MSESRRNIELNNGWILCPSKSFPGKFYYFNVLNGETAWSLNQAENKGLKKEGSFHKIADKSHRYPEPTTLPDESTITSHNIYTSIKNPDFRENIPSTSQPPTFGQATFPKYVTNVEPFIPNIVWTPVPFPMFCPGTRTPMFDKITQISDFERELFVQSSSIPLSKRFTNYEKPCLSFDKRNKIIKPTKFETSTPKNSFLECVSEPQRFSKSFIKEPVLKVEPKLSTSKNPDITKCNEKSVLSLSSKVKSTKCSTDIQVDEKENTLEKLDSTDLRFLLLAKRKSFGAVDTERERKKPKANDAKAPTPKKRVTFNVKDETDEDDSTINDEAPDDFIPSTPNPTWTNIEAPKTPLVLKDKIPPSFIKQTETQSNVKNQTETNQLPTFRTYTTRQLPTFQPTTTNQIPTFQQSATNPPSLQPTATNQHPTVKSTNWYIVVDTDILLLDYEFIEKLVRSDPKCRLVIPNVVASDIEALCLGDCRGQQRVISARQLTRKLAAPPPYCILEPRTSENGSLVTESILHCCLKAAKKNYYVVLITNDPHLQIKATLLNIPTYKLNDIKYGVDINPNTTTKQQNTKVTNTSNTAKDNTKNIFDQNINLFSNFKITSENTSVEKVVKINDKKQFDNNYRSPRKQLFLSSESETDASIDFDNLVSQTKPKSIEENRAKSDSDGTSEISSVVSSLQLKDKNILKPQNVGGNPSIPQNVSKEPFPQQNVDKNPFLKQNVKENKFGSFEKRILNPKVVFNKHSIAQIANESPTKQRKNEDNHFHNDFLDYNFENKEKSFSSIPITNMKSNESKSNLENSEVPTTCLSLRQESYVMNTEPKILNPSKIRIVKLMNSLNTDSNALHTKTKETAPVFKIPKPLPIKGTKNKSVRLERSPQNDRIVTRLSKDNIDQSVRRFFIKNKSMKAKVNTRIDEWICCYMQIMEDVLANILQQNSVCMENTVAPLTFKDTLNCVKMLYDGNTKVRDIINRLSEWLEKCMVGVQGQLKMAVAPEDFMRILGYGVLLVQELKNILPLDEDLKEAKIRLNTLHMNLQNNTKEVDPELVKSPSISRIEKDEEEIRPQFFKKTSYVIEYLKKHFKEWEAYKEDSDEQNHKIENHTDFKVVRTLGKNLNLLKIDKKKNMSLSNITNDEDVLEKEHELKIIRMLENNQLIKTENLETNQTKLMRLVNNEKNRNEFDCRSEENSNGTDSEEKDLQLNKNTVNLEQGNNFDSKEEGFNYTSHENTFLDESTRKDEPKIVRNIKVIDEFEDKLKRRVSLDLDLLDYSDIYDPSIDKNIDFDVISEKNDKNEKNNIFEIGLDYGLENSMFTLEDFYITPTISPDSVRNLKNLESKNNTENKNTVKECENSENITDSYLSSVSENNNVTNSNIDEKTRKISSEVESETYTEKESNNNTCIGNGNSEKHLDNSEKYLDISEKHLGTSEKHFLKSETLNYDSGTHLDNSESHNDIFGKVAHVLDDSTNDSGFENDSTYAHSVVKVFLKEICTTFQVIYAFVNKFVEEIRETELSDKRKDTVHNLASRALEDMVAIINHLKWIIKRESAEETVLKTLLRNAGVEATTDRRMMRYRQIVIKCLEQALILESALKIIVSTTIGDFDAISANAETIASNIRYFNIFESDYQPFVGNNLM